MSEKTIIPFTITEERMDQEGPPFNKAHADDAAYDLRAATDVRLEPGDTLIVPTGVRLAIPKGFAGLVLPRSGLAARLNITVLNSPGLIDPGYRGEVGVVLHKALTAHDLKRYKNGEHALYVDIKRGDRIAQLLIVKVADVQFEYLDALCLTKSTRGEGGYGSTGR